MNFDTETYMRMLVLKAPVLIMALSIHEFWHAYTAYLCGDDTAKRDGRVSLNPLVHLDPMGTLLMLMPYSFIGWAKPVPFVRENLNNPRRDQILIAVAGPLSNLGLAIIAALLIRGLALGAFMPLPYVFEPAGKDAKGRPVVSVRDVSTDQSNDGVQIGRQLPGGGPILAGVEDRDGSPVLLLNTLGGGLVELPQRSETVQMLLHTLWKLLALALFVNLGLLMFNLLPIFPLDGHHVVRELLPVRQSAAYMNWMVQFGPFLLLALLLIPGSPVRVHMFTAIVFLNKFLVGDDLVYWVISSLQI